MVDWAFLAFDVSLGMAAFFSPCGFPMLPAYLAYYLPRAQEGESTGRAALRGLGGGLLAGLGAFLVIGLMGALAITIGTPFKSRVAWLEGIAGVIVIVLGILVLSGRGPRFSVSLRPATRRGALGVFSFGALYALVAAGCVTPVFLFMLGQAAASASPAAGALAVAAYGVGMAGLLVLVTVLVTTMQTRALTVMRRLVRDAEKASGFVLLLVGLYLIAYWASITFQA